MLEDQVPVVGSNLKSRCVCKTSLCDLIPVEHHTDLHQGEGLGESGRSDQSNSSLVQLTNLSVTEHFMTCPSQNDQLTTTDTSLFQPVAAALSELRRVGSKRGRRLVDFGG